MVTIKRLPLVEQWRLELIKLIRCNPWRPGGDRDDADKVNVAVDGDDTEKAEIPDEDVCDASWPDDDGTEFEIRTRYNAKVRNYPLRRGGFDKYGYTDGRRGCNALQKNLKPVGHDQTCHTRLAEFLRQGTAADTGTIVRAEERIARAVLQASDGANGAIGGFPPTDAPVPSERPDDEVHQSEQ